MDKKNVLIGILIVVIVGLAVATTYLFVDNQHKQQLLDAAAQDDPAASDDPDDGVTPPDDGKPDADDNGIDGDNGNGSDGDGTPLGTMEFYSDKGVAVRLYDWTDKKALSSPVTITGEIPGNWSFEASFSATIVNWDGLIISEHPATLQVDWMTEEYVPFEVTLSFDTPSTYNRGALILQKDNPSGLPEHDDAIEIPITFEGF